MKDDRRTPLHIAACKNRSADVFETLVDACDYNERTPLHRAAQSNPNVVQMLIDCRANVNVVDNSFFQASPLYSAALMDNHDAIVALAKAGADPNLGVSPLALANDYNANHETMSLVRSLFKIS